MACVLDHSGPVWLLVWLCRLPWQAAGLWRWGAVPRRQDFWTSYYPSAVSGSGAANPGELENGAPGGAAQPSPRMSIEVSLVVTAVAVGIAAIALVVVVVLLLRALGRLRVGGKSA